MNDDMSGFKKWRPDCGQKGKQDATPTQLPNFGMWAIKTSRYQLGSKQIPTKAQMPKLGNWMQV